MNCTVACVGAAISERPERTAQGYRRFRCRDCGKQFNERTGGSRLNTHPVCPSDVIAPPLCSGDCGSQMRPARST